jgi:hypothetical protein
MPALFNLVSYNFSDWISDRTKTEEVMWRLFSVTGGGRRSCNISGTNGHLSRTTDVSIIVTLELLSVLQFIVRLGD